MKRQQIVHSYGEEEEELEDPDDFQAELEKRIHDDTNPHHMPAVSNKPDAVDVGGKSVNADLPTSEFFTESVH